MIPWTDVVAKRREQQIQNRPLTFEAVAVCDNCGNIPKVFMYQPPTTIAAYRGLWSIPRSLYNNGESDSDVVKRIEKEFGVPISNFELAGRLEIATKPQEETAMVFLIELADDPPVDDRHMWFPMNKLPCFMLKLHFDRIIPMGLNAFMQNTLK